ncbi:alpha/beta hydrolase-fold protein [Aneurinibacillus sp. Ricciae_BoGa-3]|uniref:alpha/beta hydrolase n=1 Tax=Aneurinibacillus sp. Ricciae_BoGa-3 TaxID=3022697 RepID=UPI002342106E|nr:alpha/beta hydrolase-fold protein [Aneurinibacillus sp. Ricciae_BoGa-3]WCK53539.1 alpha/beta hydrolase-fold protein [Aneurinibacillus sp. Ricciae_BoGa-3]
MDSNIRKRTIVRREIDSQHLNETRSYKVYLPPGYNPEQGYPVLYTQDGEQFLNFGRIATIANERILNGELFPFIITAVTVSHDNRTQEYGTGQPRNEMYKNFFIHELVPAVEREYSTGERTLAGDSLGGTVSLDLAINRPDLFQKVLSLSGAFYGPTMKNVRLHNRLDYLHIYMLVGTRETAVEFGARTSDFLSINRDMKQLLEEKGANVVYTEQDGGHDWGFWQSQLPEALNHFYGVK